MLPYLKFVYLFFVKWLFQSAARVWAFTKIEIVYLQFVSPSFIRISRKTIGHAETWVVL